MRSKVILLRKDVDFSVNGVGKWMGCHEMMQCSGSAWIMKGLGEGFFSRDSGFFF
jgi:hypothetical protein